MFFHDVDTIRHRYCVTDVDSLKSERDRQDMHLLLTRRPMSQLKNAARRKHNMRQASDEYLMFIH